MPSGSDPVVVQVMHALKDSLLARDRDRMREMARRWLALEDALEAEISALAHEVDKVRQDEGGVSEWRIFELTRYRQLLAQLRRELDRYSDYAEGMIVREQRRLLDLGIRHALTAIKVQAPAIRLSLKVLPSSAIEYMVGLAGDGSPLRRLLVESWPSAADGLAQALLRGTALGWNPNKTAREMRRGVSQGLNRMLTIARSEPLRVYREANRQQYAHSGVVRGYRRLAARSDRTCAGCLAADGEEYSLGEHFKAHAGCRCTLAPLVIGLPPVQWQTGAEWFARQDEETQRRILGRGRFEAYRDGLQTVCQPAAQQHLGGCDCPDPAS